MKKYLLLIFYLLLASFNFNLFLNPLHLPTGGNQGFAIIINHIINISPSIIILSVNIIMLIISYFLLSKTTTIGTIIATFIYPLFIKLTSFISLPFVNENNFLICSITAGIICGFTCGLIYKQGFSQGGINTISLILYKYFHIKIALTNFVINTIIVILGYFFFGATHIFYSLIVIIINSLLIHFILKKS